MPFHSAFDAVCEMVDQCMPKHQETLLSEPLIYA